MNKKACGYVSLIGFPNAGKSTLLNSLIKKKVSIISPKVQTTQEEIMGILNLNNTQSIRHIILNLDDKVYARLLEGVTRFSIDKKDNEQLGVYFAK